jgi:hypothetical protein
MYKVALVILFNHNYEANLEKLDKIYQGRFSNVFYIMPFYQGNRPDVISVYENSLYFQGYIATAINQLFDDQYDHYMVIGDDLILNPKINENNYQEFFGVKAGGGFVPNFFLLTDLKTKEPYRPKAPFWYHLPKVMRFDIKKDGIEAQAFLPTYEEAKARLHEHGLDFEPDIPGSIFYRAPAFKFSFKKADWVWNYKNLQMMYKHKRLILTPPTVRYPIVGSYSDCIIIPKDSAKEFARISGIFAALDLFVEVAIPTAMAFTIKDIVTEESLAYKGKTLWKAKPVNDFMEAYDHSFKRIMEEFPANTLYVHPLKLSKLSI